MSIASLSRFTVPLASGQSASSQGMLMPKLKYRFRLSFENFGVSSGTTELTKQVISAARPNVNFNPQKLDVYNSVVNYVGRPTWNTFTVKLRDDVTGAVNKLVGEQVQKQFDFYEQSSAASGGDYKFTLRIEILDGGNGANTPTVLETWECLGCIITTANYNNLAYSEQGAVDIDLTIQPDNCVQVGPGAAVGVPGSPRTVTTNVTGGGGAI